MTGSRHWVVFPKRPGDPHKFITMADAVPEWERLGYRVEGPFVPDAAAPSPRQEVPNTNEETR